MENWRVAAPWATRRISIWCAIFMAIEMRDSPKEKPNGFMICLNLI